VLLKLIQRQLMDIMLIHPPVSKPCEPPAGLAQIAGALNDHSISYQIVDMNTETLLNLLNGPDDPQDTWTSRAVKHLNENLDILRNGDAFTNISRYTRAVTEINRILKVSSAPFKTQVSLNNYQHHSISPIRSQDLIRSAQHPEESVFFEYFSNRLISLNKKYTPRIIGFSLNYLSQAVSTFAMVGFSRRIYPEAKIILGGGLVTSWVKRPGWKNPFSGLIDELVAGPGEERIITLAELEYSGRISPPDYTFFQDKSFLSPGRVAPLSTSFGCYWGKCSFCPEKAEKNRYSCLPAQSVLDDITTLRETISPSLIHLCDNAMSPALLGTIADRGIGVPWYGFARITHHLTDPDFCRALKKSGCVMLKLGLESGDQKVLDNLGKGIDLDVAAKALKAIKHAGIATYVYLLFGTPEEDRQSALKTFDFMNKYHNYVDFLNLSIFNLPRGSTESAELDTFDFSEGDLSLYQGFVHPRGWDRSKVRQFLDKEFKRHPAIARIIRSDPPVFTSNHAPFFVMKRS
jgi:hypothetical protein